MFQSYFVLSNIILFALSIALQDSLASSVGDAHCPIIKLKEEWGGKPSTAVNYRPLPIQNVIIYPKILTIQCSDFSSCAYIVQWIQTVHLFIGLDDIGYNFLISNDGLVFEGTGWLIEGGNNINSTSIGIIGKPLSAEPSIAAIEASKQLMKCGVENGFLGQNFDTYMGTQLLNPRLTKIEKSNLYDLN